MKLSWQTVVSCGATLSLILRGLCTQFTLGRCPVPSGRISLDRKHRQAMKTLEPWVGNGLYSFCIFQLYIIFKLKKYRQLCIKLVWLIPVLNWFRINFDTLTSVPIFSTLFFIHFVWYRQGEFFKQSKPLRVLIISFILMILIHDSVVLLKGENRCWLL